MRTAASARHEARKTWTARACGEVNGADAPDYFARVEAARYAAQTWARDYFRFADFDGQRVLEIGVGQGTDLLQFARSGAACSGVDITERHLDLAGRQLALHGYHADLRLADAVSLPFPDGSFDCVYSFGVLHHIPDVADALAEARRVLRPGGLLMFAVYHRWSAFHLCLKLLSDGVRRGWLPRKGYAGLLATIEGGADGVRVKPYVRLYSCRRVRALLRDFQVVDVSVHQLESDHFWPRPLARLMTPHIARLEPWLGWYVACRARKST
jgi:SAM-dependent methyltransferase